MIDYFNPPCARCARCGVSRPINVLTLRNERRVCYREDHCNALLATTPPAQPSGAAAEDRG